MSIAADFHNAGYYLAKGVFSGPALGELEREFDAIVEQLCGTGEEINARWSSADRHLDAADTEVIHTHNVQSYSAAWLRAFLHPGFVRVASEILGPDVVLHHSKLFYKPPLLGAPFPMHQDWQYFPTVRDTMIAAVIHISAATEKSGCFRLYPGSHRLGRQPGFSGNETVDRPDVYAEMLARFPVEGGTAIEAEPGDVLFFHYFTVHGSGPNEANTGRKTVLVQMHAGDDIPEATTNHPNARLVLSGRNRLVGRATAGESS